MAASAHKGLIELEATPAQTAEMSAPSEATFSGVMSDSSASVKARQWMQHPLSWPQIICGLLYPSLSANCELRTCCRVYSLAILRSLATFKGTQHSAPCKSTDCHQTEFCTNHSTPMMRTKSAHNLLFLSTCPCTSE